MSTVQGARGAPGRLAGPEPATAMPVLRWMGNKAALASPIRRAVERLAPDGSTVVDPMAGSHVVTAALKDRHRVLASDAQHASATVGRAFVANATCRRVDDEDVVALVEAASSRLRADPPGYFERTHGDTYLGTGQCREVDAMRRAIDDVFPTPADPRRDLATCALLRSACLAQASPGHFAQFLRADHPRTLALRRVSILDTTERELRAFRVEPGRAGSLSLALPWRELVRQRRRELSEAALWYLDPPYTRDQYSRFYHLLETMVLGDEPEVEHRARYRTDRFRSAFCTSGASTELAALLRSVRETSPEARVLLSYSSRGLLEREQLLHACADTHAVQGVEEHAHSYSTQGKGRLEGVVEWLVALTPR